MRSMAKHSSLGGLKWSSRSALPPCLFHRCCFTARSQIVEFCQEWIAEHVTPTIEASGSLALEMNKRAEDEERVRLIQILPTNHFQRLPRHENNGLLRKLSRRRKGLQYWPKNSANRSRQMLSDSSLRKNSNLRLATEQTLRPPRYQSHGIPQQSRSVRRWK